VHIDFFSIELFVNNYSLTVTTAKSNYFATLDEVTTQNSASQNAGPVPLTGATTMYSGLAQTVAFHLPFPSISKLIYLYIFRSKINLHHRMFPQ